MREMVGAMLLWDWDVPTKYICKKEHGAIIAPIDIVKSLQQGDDIYSKKVKFIHRRLCTSAYR